MFLLIEFSANCQDNKINIGENEIAVQIMKLKAKRLEIYIPHLFMNATTIKNKMFNTFVTRRALKNELDMNLGSI